MHTSDVPKLSAVTRQDGRRCGIADVDLQIGPGVIDLLGPNGAGKTALQPMRATTPAPSRGRLSCSGSTPPTHTPT